jgi:hypothetical protein
MKNILGNSSSQSNDSISQNKIIQNLWKYRILISLVILLIIGVVVMQSIFDKTPLDMLKTVGGRMLNPFGRTRIGLTVSENQQPFFATWITSFGKPLFWIAFMGFVAVGVKISRKNFVLLMSWIYLCGCILFTRYSSAGVFNGETFTSKFVFFSGFLVFLMYFGYVHLNKKIRENDTEPILNEYLLLAAWIIIMLIAGRGAARLFIIISPLFVLTIVILLNELMIYAKDQKDSVGRILLYSSVCIIIGVLAVGCYAYYNGVKAQSANIGPAASYQWQNAMAWMRNNTEKNVTTIAWWDYGYWIQYLGQRASVSDGGHGSGWYDVITGRWILTGERPDLTLSILKALDVNYLLIDPTDIGKYTAFSSIGSDNTGKDRMSWIAVLVSSPQNIVEQRNGTQYVYQGGTILDEDLNYFDNNTNKSYKLAGEKSGIGAIRIVYPNNKSLAPEQPIGIYISNGIATEIPLRYLYIDGRIIDYNSGFPAIARLVPAAYDNPTVGSGININPYGAAIYISPKVSKTLFANLYLMNDPKNLYPTIKPVYYSDDQVVSVLRSQGVDYGHLFYYNGLRAALTFYKIDYNENVIPAYELIAPRNEDETIQNKTKLTYFDNWGPTTIDKGQKDKNETNQTI